MRATIYMVLFILGVSFNCLLWAQEINLPLPGDAVKTSEKNANVGPTQTNIQFYTTSLSKDQVNAMYKKELTRQGWVEQKGGLFLKDDYMAVIVTSPSRNNKDKKTRFSITTTKMPTKEEVLAQRKATPDKLDFMPIYPGSSQTFLWDMPTGVSASYETVKDIKEVDFFYKSAMLSYGWSLSAEAPITTETRDCPECQKNMAKLTNNAVSSSDSKVVSNRAGLVFRKSNGDFCSIKLYQTTMDIGKALLDNAEFKNNVSSSPINKTTILVTYNGKKRVNQ